MIVSRTPLRISFVGGGTDLPSFYKKEIGEVLSTTIDKFIYVSVNRRFDRDFRLSYAQIELVNSINKIKHELVRESLKLLKIRLGKDFGLEITTISDVHGRGTGLGSSSTFTVGLLNALHFYKDKSMVGPSILSEEACDVEINICKKPIGKQDQYASSFGGFSRIKFYPDGDVSIMPVKCSESIKQELDRNLLMFYTGIDRQSENILKKQKLITCGKKFKILMDMRDLVGEAEESLHLGDLTKFGELLDKNWSLKKQLVSTISNTKINKLYEKAKKSGALGGKINGAGGRGFLLVYAEPKFQENVKKAVGLREMEFKFEDKGSKIIYGDER